MATVKTKDGVEIYYKDWGKGQPITFSHAGYSPPTTGMGRCSSSSSKAFAYIAHDRAAGTADPPKPPTAIDMDHYADDLAAVLDALDITNAVMVGHSTGGGEVVHYLARHGAKRASKAAIISAVPPLMLKTEKNPTGAPMAVFDGLRQALAANRSQFYMDLTLPLAIRN